MEETRSQSSKLQVSESLVSFFIIQINFKRKLNLPKTGLFTCLMYVCNNIFQRIYSVHTHARVVKIVLTQVNTTFTKLYLNNCVQYTIFAWKVFFKL